MSTNFLQPGEGLRFTAPAGDVETGGAYLIGSLLVIAAEDAAEGDPFVGMTEGVFRVPRVDSEEWAEGDKIYFDEGAGLFTTEDSATTLVGVAVENIDASPAQATGLVRLDGVAR